MKRPSIASLAPRKGPPPTAEAEATYPSEPTLVPAGKKGEAPPYKSILSKVDEDTHRQMKILAANEGVPIGDLQIEAINLLFRSRGLAEIATRVTPDETGKKR